MMSSSDTHVFSYVVRVDDGNAPNPFGGFLTLAICKPKIRKHAGVGDILLGTGSVRSIGQDRLVYGAIVSDVVPLDQYGKEKRFMCKRPSGKKWSQQYGDNIYFKVRGEWRQRENNHHGLSDMDRDVGGVNAVICRRFWYFGKDGPKIPREFHGIIKKGRGHRRVREADIAADVLAWLESMPRGRHGKPYHASDETHCSPLKGC